MTPSGGGEDRDPVVCNPVDLSYRYSEQQARGYPHLVWREGADPSAVLFDDRYYLFVSMSGGFWHSVDLASWAYVETPDLPVLDYAPDVREIDGALVVTASRHEGTCSFWRSRDPLSGRFEQIPGTFAFWDPNLFQDDDGRVYLYWGCSPTEPIVGVELNRSTFTPIGEPVALITSDHWSRGWEFPGDIDGIIAPEPTNPDTDGDLRPWIEGPWMTKHQGVYHLQYAAPGTQYNSYADGYFVGSAPLGPFSYSPDSPFSSVPQAFAPGAGHGSTLEDRHGNWWHFSTCRVSVVHPFERRISMHPAGFDANGALVCNQSFADHPFRVPQRRVDPFRDPLTNWRLLSRGRPVTATSTQPGSEASRVVDEDIRSRWTAGTQTEGEGVVVDLEALCDVRAVQVNITDESLSTRKPVWEELTDGQFSRRTLGPIDRPVRVTVDISVDEIHWRTIEALEGVDSPHHLVTIDKGEVARFVRVTGGPGAWGGPFCLSGVRVFGFRPGLPPAPSRGTAVRIDPRTARVTWTRGADVEGANVRYGRSPGSLTHSWLVYDRDHVVITTLSEGVDYWVAVDLFNGSGVTPGETVAVI